MGKRKLRTEPDTPCGVNAKIKLEEMREKYIKKLSDIPDIEKGAFSNVPEYLKEAVSDEIINMYIAKLKVNSVQIGKLRGNIPSKGYCDNKSNQLKNRIIDNLTSDSKVYMRELKKLYPTYNQEGKVDDSVEIPDMIWQHKDYISLGRTMISQKSEQKSYYYITNMYENFHTSYTTQQRESNVMVRMLYNMIVNNEKSIDILRDNKDFLNAEVMLLKQLDPRTKYDYYIEKLPDGMFNSLLSEIKQYQENLSENDETIYQGSDYAENAADAEKCLNDLIGALAADEVEHEQSQEVQPVEVENDLIEIIEGKIDSKRLDAMNRREREKYLDKNYPGQYEFDLEEA